MNIEPYMQILTKYWGFTTFKPLQEEIIRSVAEGKDTLGLMPTGGGKSITFQVPALAHEGICLVITPLIALMKDQVNRLNSLEIKSIAIYEAHCISQWGYDFRPSYLKIATLRDNIPDNIPFLALTASATQQVIEDIMKKLAFREKNVLRTSFVRKNISYLVRNVEDKGTYLVKTLQKAKGSGIVYVRSRKRCKEVAELLVVNGIIADFYHAGLTDELRDKKQASWSIGETRVIVATNAFGMGIDKSEVRFVIHWDIPDS